jgi:hypothetical protein
MIQQGQLTCFFSLTSTGGAAFASDDPDSGLDGFEIDGLVGDDFCSM